MNHETARSWKVRGWANQVIHVILLSFLFIVVVLAYWDTPSLLSLYSAMRPISEIFSYLPYTEWISSASHTPAIANAYISLVYLTITGLFINLLIAIFPPFSGKPTEICDITMLGFGEVLELNIYSKLTPSISFNGIGNAMVLRSSNELTHESNRRGLEWKELVDRYLAVPIIRNSYLLMWLMGFLIFPWIAFPDESYIGTSTVPFKIVILFMVYSQMKCLFEGILLLMLRFGNANKRKQE